MKEGARWRSVMSKLDARFVAAQGRERLREVLEGCTRLKELTIELQGEQLDLLALPSLRGESPPSCSTELPLTAPRPAQV